MRKSLLTVCLLLAIAPVGFSRTWVDLSGHWVNLKDTTEHLTLLDNGEFKLLYHDVLNNEHRVLTGTWLYKTTKKQKFFLFYERRPKQFFVVRKRGVLGYTLNDLRRKIIFARRVLKEGEEMPKIETSIH